MTCLWGFSFYKVIAFLITYSWMQCIIKCEGYFCTFFALSFFNYYLLFLLLFYSSGILYTESVTTQVQILISAAWLLLPLNSQLITWGGSGARGKESLWMKEWSSINPNFLSIVKEEI